MLVKETERLRKIFQSKIFICSGKRIQSHPSIVVNHLVNGFHEKINTTKRKIYSTLVLPSDK